MVDDDQTVLFAATVTGLALGVLSRWIQSPWQRMAVKLAILIAVQWGVKGGSVKNAIILSIIALSGSRATESRPDNELGGTSSLQASGCDGDCPGRATPKPSVTADQKSKKETENHG